MNKAIESNDIGRIKTAKHELETHMQHIGEAMSKAAGGNGAAGPGGMHGGEETPHMGGFGAGQHAGSESSHQAGSNDDIEEADVEIIDPDKK
jgi:molecular chaperone DnaK